ncbi:branched-chain amino acid aminotransferase [soil metagenome]
MRGAEAVVGYRASMTSTSFRVEPTTSPMPALRRERILADPGFGRHFSDHMVTAHWTPDADWHEGRVHAYAPLSMDPATAVLHYGQQIFEGMKAYAHADGSVWTFRPEVNAARFQRSARRLALPELPAHSFLDAVDLLVRTDRDWIPTGGERSLYLRPFMYASEVFLGVRSSQHVTFCIIASPASSYFRNGLKPVTIWLSTDYTRAGPGGTGSAKCGGNYASSLLPQRQAYEHDCEQVVFLDSAERTWVEELGGMNIYFVHDNGTLVTPELTDTILEGVTRDSILALGADLGLKVDERRVSLDEWRDGVGSGRITEVFACGTAAVVTPVATLRWEGGEVSSGDEPGEITCQVRDRLLDIQYGRAADHHGWLHRVC